MSAETEVRDAIIAQLRGDAALMALVNRVYDGDPVKATTPYILVGECAGSDWGTKNHAGRELRLGITIHDDAQTAVRIGQILPLVQNALGQVATVGAGAWRVGSFVLIRSRLFGREGGRWSALLDWRLRVLSTV